MSDDEFEAFEPKYGGPARMSVRVAEYSRGGTRKPVDQAYFSSAAYHWLAERGGFVKILFDRKGQRILVRPSGNPADRALGSQVTCNGFLRFAGVEGPARWLLEPNETGDALIGRLDQ